MRKILILACFTVSALAGSFNAQAVDMRGLQCPDHMIKICQRIGENDYRCMCIEA